MLPKIVIVGRPNVGKSSLLNLLAGRLVSIVDPTPGVTRDRISTIAQLPAEVRKPSGSGRQLRGRGRRRRAEAEDVDPSHPDSQALPVELIDTGGYGIKDTQNLTADVERQISLGLAEADLILFVVDAQSGLVALDQQVARLLRQSSGKHGKAVLLIANKVDSDKDESGAAEAARLGFGPPLMVSALTGNNKDLLLEAIRANLPATEKPEKGGADLGVLLAIIGKRNAGKSTLVNALCGQERMIVSELEGTTRDSVDVRFEHGGRTFTAIDTAGVRKTKSLKGDVEFYSQHRALRSIRRADVVLLLLDATIPVSHVDQQLAHEIVTHFKPAMIVVNKWDLAEKALKQDLSTQDKYMEYLDKHLPILSYCPVAFISAKKDEGLRELLEMARKLHNQAAQRVTTATLNKAMEAAMAAKPPTSGIGRRPRVYYMTQLASAPPTIILFVNDPSMFDPAYQRYLINRFRETLPFGEVPMKLIIRGKEDKRTEAE